MAPLPLPVLIAQAWKGSGAGREGGRKEEREGGRREGKIKGEKNGVKEGGKKGKRRVREDCTL